MMTKMFFELLISILYFSFQQFRPMEGPSGALGFVPALPRNLYRAPAPPQPTVPSYGQDYRRGGFRVDPTPKMPEPRTMLTKLNQSLNQSLWSPPSQQDAEDYQFTPLSQLRQNYNAMTNGKCLWFQNNCSANASVISDPARCRALFCNNNSF